MDPALPSPIGPEQAALIARPVSIIVGSRDAQLRPHVMRAVGCRLSDDRRRVTLLMPAHSGGAVLDDLRANGQVAVVFSEPTTHRTLQVKGEDAVVTPCGADDAALAERTLQGFTDEIGQLGFTAEVAHTILAHEHDLLAVHFSVASAFEQTPGPAAGEPLAAPRNEPR
jgi:Pyridoxamine 5'-phosphate oxidase